MEVCPFYEMLVVLVLCEFELVYEILGVLLLYEVVLDPLSLALRKLSLQGCLVLAAELLAAVASLVVRGVVSAYLTTLLVGDRSLRCVHQSKTVVAVVLAKLDGVQKTMDDDVHA